MGRIADNVISLKTSLGGVFEAWLDSTHLLLHNLTPKERAVMAAYLRKHYEISQKTNDEAILQRILTDETTKRQILEECNIKRSHLQVILTSFKKEGLLVNGVIKPSLIPAITPETTQTGEFRLLIVFKING